LLAKTGWPRLWLAKSLSSQYCLAKAMASEESSYPRLSSQGYANQESSYPRLSS